MKILICGDRNWNDQKAIESIVSKFPKGTIVIHGDARGADKIAGLVAQKLGYEVEAYPAEWDVYGRSAGPVRNRQMLNEGKPNRVIAFHDDIESSKGTKDMVKISKKANLPTLVISHNGNKLKSSHFKE